MTAKITTDIFCDVCNTWIHGGVSDKPKRREARERAKKLGWVRVRHGKRWMDLCPTCAERLVYGNWEI